jgi:UDP-N-acetylmuramate--alanine ligase
MTVIRPAQASPVAAASGFLDEILHQTAEARHQVRIHLVGIGGSGLSAIARVLLQLGYAVSGSDRQPGSVLLALQAEGAQVFVGHAAANVVGADLVLISSAIAGDNVEVVTAAALGLPVVKRSTFLGALLRHVELVAVAGTHGKTTTTAMIASVLTGLGYAPGYIVGSQVRGLGTNAAAGAGTVFVIEADEYDHMFLGLHPQVALVTNVEWDHPDCYPTPDSFAAAFASFVEQIRPAGWLVTCLDDPGARRLAEGYQAHAGAVLTYGLSDGAGMAARAVHVGRYGGCVAQVWQAGEWLGELQLRVPGLHNLRNALGVLGVVSRLGLDPVRALPILANFEGVGRRFEFKGGAGGVRVYDDYAHHPTEIRATLAAARARWPARTIWAVFQPHTYSRTQALWHDFAQAFGDAQHVRVMPVYAARDAAIPGVTGEALAAALHHGDAHYVGDAVELVNYLADHVRPGDVLITLGAGDGYLIGERLLEALRGR